jgi:uncharacterized protein YecE (DUF72 family)
MYGVSVSNSSRILSSILGYCPLLFAVHLRTFSVSFVGVPIAAALILRVSPFSWAMTAKGLAGIPGSLSRGWYGRKVALIPKTIRQCWQVRGLREEIKRLRSMLAMEYIRVAGVERAFTAPPRPVLASGLVTMDDPRQERLSVENPGRISPPEPGLYLGTSGWSYADWEGTLYPEGLPAGARLADYAKHSATVEIDSTFYGTPRNTTVEKWRETVPEGFLFAAKFPQEVTHERKLVNIRSQAEGFVHTMQALDDRLGPLLLQLPPDFTVEGMGVLEDFLRELPEGPRYAVEVRHRSWIGSDLPELLRECGAALTLVDYPRMPRQEEATTDFAYIRWLGNRREFPSGHTHLKKDRDGDLLWWASVVDRFLKEGKTVFAYANNHYQNHSPSTLERFLELRRGDR